MSRSKRQVGVAYAAPIVLRHRLGARYQNRAIETAQVSEELIEMAKKFREAAGRGEERRLIEDDFRFYDTLANDESAVRELSDETLKKIAHEPTENPRQNPTVDWPQRENVRARRHLMVLPHNHQRPTMAFRGITPKQKAGSFNTITADHRQKWGIASQR